MSTLILIVGFSFALVFSIGFAWGLLPPMEQDRIEDEIGIRRLKERIKNRLQPPSGSFNCGDLPEVRNARTILK